MSILEKMKKETKTQVDMKEEWLKWMVVFEEEDIDGKLRGMSYLLMQLIDCTFDNKAMLGTMITTMNLQMREMNRQRGFVV